MKFVIFIFLFATSGQFVLAQEEKKDTPDDDKKSFSEMVSFEEGTFLGNINKSFLGLAEKVESWRSEKSEKFKESLDKTDDVRQEKKDSKGFDKIMVILKIFLLALLVFIFSLQVAFYVIATIILFLIIRKIFNTLFGWIRNRNN